MLKHSTLLALFWATEVASISSKKGLCVSPNNFQCQDMQLFPNISWWERIAIPLPAEWSSLISKSSLSWSLSVWLLRFYNWGTEFVGSSCPSPPPGFVPMVVCFAFIIYCHSQIPVFHLRWSDFGEMSLKTSQVIKECSFLIAFIVKRIWMIDTQTQSYYTGPI